MLDYFLFQLLSELCFPTCKWSMALSKVCFKFSDQTNMNYQYPHVASVRMLFFVSIHSYYRDQRRIDCRLTFYKVTYDLVAIPASDYLTSNHRQSRHIHTLAYRQIPTLKNYDKYTFFPRTIIHWNALPAFIPLLPTLAQFSNVVCQVVYPVNLSAKRGAASTIFNDFGMSQPGIESITSRSPEWTLTLLSYRGRSYFKLKTEVRRGNDSNTVRI